MIRIREILDPELRRQVVEKLAEWRGMPAGSIPEWFELDDADYADLLSEINHPEEEGEAEDDHRM